MNIKMIKKIQNIISSDYKFDVLGANNYYEKDLFKAEEEGMVKIKITVNLPDCPDRKSFSLYKLITESGVNKTIEDATYQARQRKVKGLFKMVKVDDNLLKDEESKYFLLTEDEKNEMIEFLQDEKVEEYLIQNFFKKRERPDYIVRRDEKKKEEDIFKYADWLAGKELVSKYVKMLWKMYWIRGYMSNESIKRQFMEFPLTLNQKFEMIRMELLGSFNNFLKVYVDDACKEMPIFDCEKWLEMVYEDLIARINYWKDAYDLMKSIYEENSNHCVDHLADKSFLLEDAIRLKSVNKLESMDVPSFLNE